MACVHEVNDVAKPPVFLVHGWAGSFQHTWQRSGLVDLLSEAGREVTPYDLPGHGASEKSHDPLHYQDLPRHLIDHVSRHRRVDAVGFSLGAITLLHALVAAPTSFGTVILAGIGDGVFQPHEPARAERILSGLEGRAEAGDLTARLFGKIGNEAHNDPKALAAVLRRPRELPVTGEQLGTIPNPVTIALGTEDFSAPATELVAGFPNARLVMLKGIDHFRTPESFEFIDLVLDTLSVP